MILAIITAVCGVSAFVFTGLSTNAKSKALEIIFTVAACVFLLGFGVSLVFLDNNVQDKAEAAEIKTTEATQEQMVEITPTNTESIITITTESLTPEMLVKMFIDKWNGVLPDTVIIYGADQYEHSD